MANKLTNTRTVSSRPFSPTSFWAAVGVSVIGCRCCVYVDTNEPGGVIQPQNDRKYISHTIFKFTAAKKVPYASIVTNLTCARIYPGGSAEKFKPPVNPDNKYYTGLRADDLANILNIIRRTICGISLDDNGEPFYEERPTNPAVIEELRRRERPPITIDGIPMAIITNVSNAPNEYTIHQFSRQDTRGISN
jgi:hypothetical protein